MITKFKTLLSLGLILFSTAAYSQGVGSGGGGDTQGMSVYRQFKRMGMRMMSVGASFLDSKQVTLVRNIINSDELLILMSDSILDSKVGNIVQSGGAYSQKINNSYVIQINRAKWNATTNDAQKEALLAHELFVLAELESTGDYHLSNQFAESSKILTDIANRGGHFIGDVLSVDILDTVTITNPRIEIQASNPNETNMQLPISIVKESCHQGICQVSSLHIKLKEILCREFGFGPPVGNVLYSNTSRSRGSENPKGLCLELASDGIKETLVINEFGTGNDLYSFSCLKKSE